MKNLLKITHLSISFTTIDKNSWKLTANFFTFLDEDFSENLENSNQKESVSLFPTISELKEKWNSSNLSSTSTALTLTYWKGNPTLLREAKLSAKTFSFKTFLSLLNTDSEY